MQSVFIGFLAATSAQPTASTSRIFSASATRVTTPATSCFSTKGLSASAILPDDGILSPAWATATIEDRSNTTDIPGILRLFFMRTVSEMGL